MEEREVSLDVPMVAVFLSNQNLDHENFSESILRGEMTNPFNRTSNEFIKLQEQWTLSNKYYEAEITLTIFRDNWLENLEKFRTKVEAVIIYWDNKQNTNMEDLNRFTDHVSEIETCLLVVDGFDGEEDSQQEKAKKWCLDRKWDLVELDALVDNEDDFPESIGCDRIREAINSNQWSNMQIIKAPKKKDGETILKADPYFGCPTKLAPDSKSMSSEPDLDDSMKEFEDLFAQFSSMKINTSSLDRDARLDYAENMAKSFMNAIGDDDYEEEDDSADYDDEKDDKEEKLENDNEDDDFGKFMSALDPNPAKEYEPLDLCDAFIALSFSPSSSEEVNTFELTEAMDTVPTTIYSDHKIKQPISKMNNQPSCQMIEIDKFMNSLRSRFEDTNPAELKKIKLSLDLM